MKIDYISFLFLFFTIRSIHSFVVVKNYRLIIMIIALILYLFFTSFHISCYVFLYMYADIKNEYSGDVNGDRAFTNDSSYSVRIQNANRHPIRIDQ